jgi:hypothetical protein
MPNVLDNEVILEEVQGVVIWKDFVTGIEKLRLLQTGTNPNGVLSAPKGSIASGASGAWENTSPFGGTAWSLISTSSAGAFLAPNEYYVDSSQISNPPLRIYPSVEDAIIGAELEQTGPYMLRLRQAQFHLWGGTGIPAASTRDITIYGETETGTTLNVSAILPDGAAGAALRFQNLTVSLDGDLDLGANRRLIMDGAFLTGNNFSVILEGPGFSCEDTVIGDTRFFGDGVGIAAASFERCTVNWAEAAPGPFLSNCSSFTMVSSDVQGARSAASTLIANGTVVGVTGFVSNSSFVLEKNGASVDTFTIFTVGAGGIEFAGTTFVWNLPAGGSLDFGVGAAVGVIGISSFGVDPLNLPLGSWHNVAGSIVAA